MVGNMPKKVVSRELGERTGDEFFIDEHGTWWELVKCLSEPGTGDRRGILIDGQIREI